MSECSIQYSSSETNFSGKLIIGNNTACPHRLFIDMEDNDEDIDNTDDDTVLELITSEYIIRAFDMDHTDVAAVESVANITVTNTTSPSDTSDSPSTEESNATSNINTTNTTDLPSG